MRRGLMPVAAASQFRAAVSWELGHGWQGAPGQDVEAILVNL